MIGSVSSTSSSSRKLLLGVLEGQISKTTTCSTHSLSQDKEDRAAFLKARFAGTIQKAQQGTLLVQVSSAKVKEKHNNETVEAAKKKLVFAKKQQDDFLKRIAIEAKIKSDKEAERVRELKKLREDARKATQQIQRTVFLDENMESMMDFGKLVGLPQSSSDQFYRSYKFEDERRQMKYVS